MDARNAFDQCRFPRPVLAHEGVDLAPLEGEVDVAQGLHAREMLETCSALEQDRRSASAAIDIVWLRQ